MKSLITNYLDGLIAVCLAACGGFIRLIANYKTGQKVPTVGRVFVEVLIAGFSGLLVEALLRKWGVDSDTKIVVVAISGYAAREVIELLRTFASGILQAALKKKDGKDEGGESDE